MTRVSVVTPTWQRHDTLLNRCLPSVAAQEFTDFEHIIVSDGPDPELEAILGDREPLGHRQRYLQLAEHPPDSSWGVHARICGDDTAIGELLAPLDDDDAFRPKHLALLVDALDRTGADFAYSHMQVNYRSGGFGVVGQNPPCHGQIGVSFLYRRELLALAGWRTGQPTIDWDLVQRWIAAGATWAYVPEVTIDAYPSAAWR